MQNAELILTLQNVYVYNILHQRMRNYTHNAVVLLLRCVLTVNIKVKYDFDKISCRLFEGALWSLSTKFC